MSGRRTGLQRPIDGVYSLTLFYFLLKAQKTSFNQSIRSRSFPAFCHFFFVYLLVAAEVNLTRQ